MSLTSAIFGIGAAVAAILLGLLLLTLVIRPLRIWPTRGDGSWQSYVFWPLFRGLNVLCFAMALADRSGRFLGLSTWMRGLVVAFLAASIASFIYAFRKLGRDNSYGGQDGLVTGGIYRWSRNPQNAMLIVVYGCLAVVADSGRTYVLCAGMMAVYFIMVLAEEPWLRSAYGAAYQRYCAVVPRFFNWRRAGRLARVWARATIGRRAL
jgi:protein-S-isoprenylcysteine O-methyltransferase Ste14